MHNSEIKNQLINIISERKEFYDCLLNNHKLYLTEKSNEISNAIYQTHKSNCKTILCGNGGSHSQSSHLATELIIRFKANSNRPPLAAIAISSDSGVITAGGNDFGYDEIFSRQLGALLKKDDCLIAFSTSGTSKNILNAISTAKTIIDSSKIFLITGYKHNIKDESLNLVHCPIKGSTETYQEFHLLLIHMVCNALELIYA